MGTRANIVVHHSDGRWGRIYTHWDGYPEHHGVILRDCYSNQVSAEALIALGDLSSLGFFVSQPEGHSFTNPVDGYCVAYGRDRGEDGCKPQFFDSLSAAWPSEDDAWIEFIYVWNEQGEEWLVASPSQGTGALRPVADVLAELNAA